jgi:hypothetical protein
MRGLDNRGRQASGEILRRPWKAELFAGTNRTGQAAVIDPVIGVPKRLTELHTAAENLDLLLGSRRRIGRMEIRRVLGGEVFVMSITKDGLENILANCHENTSVSKAPAGKPQCDRRMEAQLGKGRVLLKGIRGDRGQFPPLAEGTRGVAVPSCKSLTGLLTRA